MKLSIFRKSVQKIQLSLKSYMNKVILNEEQYTFLIISRSFLLKMRNVSAEVLKKTKTHFIFSNFFFLNRAIYEIMWKNTVQPDRPQMPI